MELKLAVQLHQANLIEEALELALSILVKDLNFGDAKKLTLDVSNAVPNGAPLKLKYRRKVFSLMY